MYITVILNWFVVFIIKIESPFPSIFQCFELSSTVQSQNLKSKEIVCVAGYLIQLNILKVGKLLAISLWFLWIHGFSSIIKTDSHGLNEIFLKTGHITNILVVSNSYLLG
jgi:hypothetical protein